MPDTAVVDTEARGRIGQNLAVAALGIVYGDIGTSPLYTVKQCFDDASVNETRVFGVLSLIAWSLTLVVTVKYVLVMMRADNRGEGGILALMVAGAARRRRRAWPLDHVGRADRRRAVLRRRRHHAIDFRAERG